jgi:hypothetical protein
MRKIILTIVAIYAILMIKADTASAETLVAETSAQLKGSQPAASDYRVQRLTEFFEKYDSPLANFAEDFVFLADKYDIDWRLVPAISGVESTFGKRIPYNSYNAYGWANGDYSFNSWEESIEIVSKTLREKYMDKGAVTINQIARRYAPPSSTWAGKVRFFLRKIEPFPVGFELEG